MQGGDRDRLAVWQPLRLAREMTGFQDAGSGEAKPRCQIFGDTPGDVPRGADFEWLRAGAVDKVA